MERWKQIEGFGGRYLVSDHGRILSIRRMGTAKRAKTVSDWMLKPEINYDGYHRYTLYLGKTPKHHLAHRLVARAFVGKTNALTVNHKDGDKTNNHFSNLEYLTAAKNTSHAFASGLMKKHFTGRDKSLTKTERDEIKSLRGKMRPRDIAAKFSVSYATIYNVWGPCSERIDVKY